MRAACRGNNEIALALINGGADVNIADKEGKTALMLATKHEDVVVSLIKQGKALVNVFDNNGRTALFYALAEANNTAVCFLDNGANLHLTGKFNVSVLSFVIHHFINMKSKPPQIQECLKLLKEKGIEEHTIITTIINAVFCKISMLSMSANENILPMLQVAVDFIKTDNDPRKGTIQSIISTIELNEITLCKLSEILSMLIDLGADPNTADENGNTACHYFVQSVLHTSDTSIDLDSIYQQCSFGFTKKNCNEETPLLFCLSNALKVVKEEERIPGIANMVKICSLLLKNSTSVNETSQSGKSVFHLSIQLVQEGLSLQDQQYQETFLHEILQLLQLFSHPKVRKDVTVNMVDDDLNSPLHYWASLVLPSAQQYISKDAKVNFDNLIKTILESLLSCGALLNSRNRNEETPLHRSKTLSALKLLVDAGAKTSDVDGAQRTPLLVAARNRLFLEKPDYFYPDVRDDSTTFWKSVTSMGFDALASDKDGDSVMSNLLDEEVFVLAKGLIELVCDESLPVPIPDEAVVGVLNAVCKDKSSRTIWKTMLVQMILKSRRRPTDLSSFLRVCCRNILDGISASTTQLETSRDVSRSGNGNNALTETKSSVTTDSAHWQVAKQLLLYGASGQSCLDLADNCAELKDLLTKPPSIDEIPMVIPWTSYSKTYEKKLAEVARRRNCRIVEGTTYLQHSEHIASGTFGLVFAGINEQDGMEVAIKRIEKLRMPRPEDKREIRTFTALTSCKRIVHYLAFWEYGDFSYVMLELMEGNLDDYFGSACYDPGKGTILSEHVVVGLQYLHDQNILHRDLKPSNILYKTHPRLCLKIADFGLSRPSNIDLSVTVMSASAGTRGWIAPEVVKSSDNVHSMSSDIFSCGLILHYLFAKQKHPFNPTVCTGKSNWQILTEREGNILKNRMEGWHNSLPAEVSHLVQWMLEIDDKKRPSASDLLNHPMFWSDKKKMDLLRAVGNQPEFEYSRAKRLSLKAVGNELNGTFSTIVTFVKWNDTRYTHMPTIYTEMMQPIVKTDKKGKKYTGPPRKYDTGSVVELVRFIRNAIAHVSDVSRTSLVKDQILSKFVFLKEFPNLVMEVYKAVIKHRWDARQEIQLVIGN